MIDGLDFARFDIGIAPRGELDALGVDFLIPCRVRIAHQAFPCDCSEPLPLSGREGKYLLLKLDDSAHGRKCSSEAAVDATRLKSVCDRSCMWSLSLCAALFEVL